MVFGKRASKTGVSPVDTAVKSAPANAKASATPVPAPVGKQESSKASSLVGGLSNFFAQGGSKDVKATAKAPVAAAINSNVARASAAKANGNQTAAAGNPQHRRSSNPPPPPTNQQALAPTNTAAAATPSDLLNAKPDDITKRPIATPSSKAAKAKLGGQNQAQKASPSTQPPAKSFANNAAASAAQNATAKAAAAQASASITAKPTTPAAAAPPTTGNVAANTAPNAAKPKPSGAPALASAPNASPRTTATEIQKRIQQLDPAAAALRQQMPSKKVIADFESLFDTNNVEESIKMMQTRFAEEVNLNARLAAELKTVKESMEKFRDENKKRAFTYSDCY
jgi:hypothetical protein